MILEKKLIIEMSNLIMRNLGLAMLVGWAIASIFLLRMIIKWKDGGRIYNLNRLLIGLAIGFVFIGIEHYVRHVFLVNIAKQSSGLRAIHRGAERRHLATNTKIGINQVFPVFEIETENDGVRTLPMDGKSTVVFFYEVDSSLALRQLKILNEFWNVYQSSPSMDLVVIGVKMTNKDVNKFFLDNELNLPKVADETGEIYEKFVHAPAAHVFLISVDKTVESVLANLNEDSKSLLTEFAFREDFKIQKLGNQ